MTDPQEHRQGALNREGRVLGAMRYLRSVDVARRAGVSVGAARRFWRSLGFAAVGDDLHAFTDRDARAMAHMSSLVRTKVIEESTALALTRSVGQSMGQLSAWQIELLSEVARARLGSPTEAELASELADLVTELADDLEPLLTYVWRRHLTSALATHMVDLLPPDGVVAGRHSVGFADLVNYTQTIHRLGEPEVARLVQRFEELAAACVAELGGRLVKSVGDAVLFTTRDAVDCVHIAFRLVRMMGQGDLPQVHVGIATGSLVNRLGDVFGTTVNRASRISATARAGEVIIDDATAAAIADSTDIVVRGGASRDLKGLGRVETYSVGPVDPETAQG
ncbi:MAG: adenylate/guanylate cyclase domain-containing protein [Micrococcales bacterium]|nr:MAG: adenylate/guanylate cyclase domain-containing protein [Micrococcales bacterium]PIE28028.1 MAG: adenylate/guanylate cyclase domain-containing protein [Micrococcales bacterium]